jgi:hypothetical protein
MARIRTIKPDFFRHGGLFDLEKESGLPVRVAFAGLWTASDRAGRFLWRPRELKLDCLPYDEVDFSRVLDALRTRHHIEKYIVDGVEYGFIPSWDDHQVINNRETPSAIPEPTETSIAAVTCTREARVIDASATPLVHAQAEGKGREGEGNGREGSGPEPASRGPVPAPKASPTPSPKKPDKGKPEGVTAGVWNSYAAAYERRYRCDPLRDATVNGILAKFVGRVGADDAPAIAAFYVGTNAPFYVKQMHPVSLLLRDAEALRTQWTTGRAAPETNRFGAPVIDINARNAEAKRLLGFGQQEVLDAS